MSFLSSVNDQGASSRSRTPHSTTISADVIKPFAELARKVPKQRAAESSAALDDIAYAIRQHEQTDRYGITGMNIAGKLRQLCEMDAKVGEKFVLKADELTVDLTKATITVQNGEVVE
ncbi:hypothetical protein Q1695_011542 [Nippostrongylus brasiliensis]|nr:hypothetical protein Q1695_011542 [Nippostrongylus brasiliensis]